MNRRDFIKSAIIGAAGVSVPLGVEAKEYTPVSSWQCKGRTLKWDYALTQEQVKRIQEYLCSVYDLEESDTPIVSTQIALNS